MSRLLCVILVGLGLAHACSARAATIYSQTTPAEPAAAFSSNDLQDAQKVADSFVLSGMEPLTIRSLRFIGGYTVRNPPPSTPPFDSIPRDNFRIVFLEGENGIPEVIVPGADFLIDSAFQRRAIEGSVLNGFIRPIEYSVNLNEGLTLSPFREYWVTIMNDPGPDHSWQWARAVGVHDSITASTRGNVLTGPWDTFANGGMWFELNDHNIPEPYTLTFLLIGLFATAGYGGRS